MRIFPACVARTDRLKCNPECNLNLELKKLHLNLNLKLNKLLRVRQQAVKMFRNKRQHLLLLSVLLGQGASREDIAAALG